MILVTGGTGLVGSHLIFQLLKGNDLKLRATYRDDSNREHLKTVFAYFVSVEEASEIYSRIEWIKANILDVTDLETAFQNITHVYHCAAIVSYDLKDVKRMRKINIEGTENVVNISLANGVKKFCHVSSIAAIGFSEDDTLIDEETPWNPEVNHSAYAWSKYGAEIEVWRGSQEGLDVVIVNPGVIIGSGFWDSGSGLLFKKTAKGLPYGPTLTTGFVDVQDVVKAMITLMISEILNERFVLVSENLKMINVLKDIAKNIDAKSSIKPLKPWMVAIGWFFQHVGRLFFNTSQTISFNAIKGVFKKKEYDNTKIIKAIDFSFSKLENSLNRVAQIFKSKA